MFIYQFWYQKAWCSPASTSWHHDGSCDSIYWNTQSTPKKHQVFSCSRQTLTRCNSMCDLLIKQWSLGSPMFIYFQTTNREPFWQVHWATWYTRPASLQELLACDEDNFTSTFHTWKKTHRKKHAWDEMDPCYFSTCTLMHIVLEVFGMRSSKWNKKQHVSWLQCSGRNPNPTIQSWWLQKIIQSSDLPFGVGWIYALNGGNCGRKTFPPHWNVTGWAGSTLFRESPGESVHLRVSVYFEGAIWDHHTLGGIKLTTATRNRKAKGMYLEMNGDNVATKQGALPTGYHCRNWRTHNGFKKPP